MTFSDVLTLLRSCLSCFDIAKFSSSKAVDHNMNGPLYIIENANVGV
jgi:hypothetical protein